MKFFFICKFFPIFWSWKPWIWIWNGIQPNMLDPESMNPDTKHWWRYMPFSEASWPLRRISTVKQCSEILCRFPNGHFTFLVKSRSGSGSIPAPCKPNQLIQNFRSAKSQPCVADRRIGIGTTEKEFWNAFLRDCGRSRCCLLQPHSFTPVLSVPVLFNCSLLAAERFPAFVSQSL